MSQRYPASRINIVLFTQNVILTLPKGLVFILCYQENRKRRKPLPKIGISKRFLFETSLKYVYRKTKFYSFKNGNIRWKIETIVKFSFASLLVLFRYFFFTSFLSLFIFFFSFFLFKHFPHLRLFFILFVVTRIIFH